MNKYYIRQGGKSIQGPFGEDRVRAWIQDGKIRPGMELSTDRTNWVDALDHELGRVGFAIDSGASGVADPGGGPARVAKTGGTGPASRASASDSRPLASGGAGQGRAGWAEDQRNLVLVLGIGAAVLVVGFIAMAIANRKPTADAIKGAFARGQVVTKEEIERAIGPADLSWVQDYGTPQGIQARNSAIEGYKKGADQMRTEFGDALRLIGEEVARRRATPADLLKARQEFEETVEKFERDGHEEVQWMQGRIAVMAWRVACKDDDEMALLYFRMEGGKLKCVKSFHNKWLTTIENVEGWSRKWPGS